MVRVPRIAREMLDVEDRLIEKLRDVRVVQLVEDLLSPPLADDEPQMTQ